MGLRGSEKMLRAAMLAAVCCLAVPATAFAASDPDMELFKSKIMSAVAVGYKFAVWTAAVYYIVAVIRFFSEDSDLGAKKHLLSAGVALFISASALPIVEFVLYGFFPQGEYGDIPSGSEAVRLALLVVRRLFTAALNVGIAMCCVYMTVAFLRYMGSENAGSDSKYHIIRAAVGLFLLVIARAAVSFAVFVFAK